ncbi:MAG: TolC family protein [Spirochaetales bacterium]|nr:TolC family protein [Spirochaetales bacterium]
MKRFVPLLILLIINPLCYGQEVLTPDRLLSLLEKNNPQWEAIRLDREKSLLESRTSALDYRPSWGITPYYSLNTENAFLSGPGYEDILIHTVGATLEGSLLLPSRGTLGWSLSDGWNYLSSESSHTNSQDLSFDLTLTQPLLTGGKFLNGLAYGAERRISVEIPRMMNEINSLIALNSLVEETLSAYMALLVAEETFQLNRRKQELNRQNLDRLSSLRERGLYSGTDFWKRQLETDQSEDDLLEEKYRLEADRERLASSLGIQPDGMILPVLSLSEEDLPPLPAAADSSYLKENRERQLALITEERERLRRDGGLNQSPSQFSVELSLSPQYDPAASTERDLGGSYSDLFEDGGWMETSLTVSLNYSPQRAEKNRLADEHSRVAVSSARIDRERLEKDLLENLKDLLDRDTMLRSKLERIDESLLYQKNLLEREEKLLSLSSSTPLAVEEARLNVDLRALDRKKTLLELYSNRRSILSLAGGEMKGGKN